MAKARIPGSSRNREEFNQNHGSSNTTPQAEEGHGLLSAAGDGSDGGSDETEEGDGADVHQAAIESHHSALSKTNGNGGARTPRTPNRVRFDLIPTSIPPQSNGQHDRYDGRNSEDDDIELGDHDPLGSSYSSSGRETFRQPLLTGIEAPSVTLANSVWGDDVGEWHEAEQSRPKSGMRSAFMNMANSIIGAGIIGQPYAFKQAGLLAGIVLLIGLTIVVDWTIRLIVVNSKLSGANSFQGTVEHCFGKTGLIAISIAQWAFAFGGMVAFGVVVGDSIPHVLQAVWPGLSDIPVLGLLADRRVVIAVFILGVSYPLTLYRDIAKVSGQVHGEDLEEAKDVY
jgi:sodium-coupled neutral amino acid transporter 11